MEVYNVTFINDYWHITTTVEHDCSSAHWREEVIEKAAELIRVTSGLDLDRFTFVDIAVDYEGLAV